MNNKTKVAASFYLARIVAIKVGLNKRMGYKCETICRACVRNLKLRVTSTVEESSWVPISTSLQCTPSMMSQGKTPGGLSL